MTKNQGELARQMSERFGPWHLEHFELEKVESIAPGAAITTTSLIVNGFSAKSEQRWFYEDRAGKHQPDFKPGGVWKTIMTFPDEWAPESSAFL